MPTHTPIGTHTKLASAIKMNTRNMVSDASPHTSRASRSGVFLTSTQTMCQRPRTTAAITSDTHRRSRLLLGAAGASAGLSVRFTTRLVQSTAA